ncbi:MAG: twin-arginine translocation signal domain-containing protein, partial [Verrucomicrobium sp.]
MQPSSSPEMNRRQFLQRTSLALGAAGLASASLPSTLMAQEKKAQPFQIIAFSKPFQTFSPKETADFVAEVGWDGIECPVRAKGQVLPERVEEDLPKMVE